MAGYYQPNYYQQYGYPQQNYQYVPPMTTPVQLSQINGKIVDSKEVAASQEIALGSYGVFPRGDLGMIYVKSWNNDGTTRIDEYKRVEQIKESDTTLDDIKDSIVEINKKLDSFVTSRSAAKKVVVKDES